MAGPERRTRFAARPCAGSARRAFHGLCEVLAIQFQVWLCDSGISVSGQCQPGAAHAAYHYRVQTNQIDSTNNLIKSNQWVRFTYGEKNPFNYDKPKMFTPQSDWITDYDGTILVDLICRFEHLRDNFSAVCRTPEVEVTLPHLKASKRGYYRNYYNDDTAKIVAACDVPSHGRKRRRFYCIGSPTELSVACGYTTAQVRIV
jgi:hypothetical protein